MPSIGAAAPAQASAASSQVIGPHDEGERLPPRPGIEVASDQVSKIIFLNRCSGGCLLEPGDNDARTNHSSILDKPALVNGFDLGDTAWQQLVACVREIYAPYDVVVTDQDPGVDIFHHEAIVGADYMDIDYDHPINGVAPSQCVPRNNVVSFTFVNGRTNPVRICETLAQETAHSFGLEHAYDCEDPMTYLPWCGRRFFRDRKTPCGENTQWAECSCGGNAQNSHRWLRTVLGANAVTPPGPELEILIPADGDTVSDGFRVAAEAVDMRGVLRVELYLNGSRVAEVAGFDRDHADQTYWFETGTVADGVIDVEIRAYNDIESVTARTHTVTKGSPCAGDGACFDGQSCRDGRCSYPPAVGNLGDLCQRDSDCQSGLCPQSGDLRICSEWCFPTTTPTCPDGFDCLEVAVNEGVCWPADGGSSGGLCTVDADRASSRRGGHHSAWIVALALVIAVTGTRRRKNPRKVPGRA